MQGVEAVVSIVAVAEADDATSGAAGKGSRVCQAHRHLSGIEETVGDESARILGIRLPSQQSATAITARAEQTAGEGAALDGGIDSIAHQSSVEGLALDGRSDDNAAGHISQREVGGAIASYHTTGIAVRGVDGAHSTEVLDSGTVCIGKRAAEVAGCCKVDGERLPIAVESSEEGVTAISTNHPCDGFIAVVPSIAQFEVSTVETILSVVVCACHLVGQFVPFGNGADDVRVVSRACVVCPNSSVVDGDIGRTVG